MALFCLGDDMAQYDGSIRINTEINTKDASSQLMKLENNMQKAADKVSSLRSKMDSLKDVQIPTQEYVEIQKQIETTKKKINDLIARQEKFLSTGGKETSSAFQKMQYDLEELRNSLPYLQGELQDLVDTGKAFILGSDTEEYANLGRQLQYEENHLAQLNARWREYIARQSSVSERFSQMRDSAKKALNAIHSGFSSVGNIGKKAFSNIFSMAKKAFSAITKGSKQSNASVSAGLKTILKYTLGIRSLYVLFNKLRSAAKEGLSNLAQYSTPVNESISMLMSSLTQLKNSLATAFAPIITTIAPILTSFINMLSQAATYVGMFIATLTGAKTFTKATAVQEDYAKSLNGTASAAKKAAGALAKFDDLDVLQKTDTSGGGAGGVSVGDMFEEVEIPNRFEGIVEWFKKMWDDSDFKELGEYIANGLKNALDGISWSNIKESARNIAKSIATFLNGAIESEGLGYSIGSTLAQGINTGFEFLNSFVHKFDWKSAGSFIADQLNGLFDGIDWELIYDTFVTGFHGLAESINEFISTFKWDNVSESISWIIRTAADSLTEFFTTTEFKELGTRIGEQFEKLLEDDKMWYSVGKSIGKGLQAAFDFVKGFLSGIHFEDVVEAIKNTLAGFFEGFDDEGELALIILGVIAAKLALKATVSMFASAATVIGSSIGSSLTAYALPAILAAVAAWGIVGAINSIIEGETAIDSIVSGGFKERIIEDYDQIAHASADSVLSIVESNNELVESFDNANEKATEMREQFETNVFSPLEQGFLALTGQIEETSASVEDLKNTTKESTDDMSRTWGIAKDSIVGGIAAITDGMKVSFSKTYKSILDDTRSFIADLKKMMEGMSAIGGSVVGGMAAAMPRSNYSVSTASMLNDIPALASGSVIRGGNPFMAILGDQPRGQTNIEAPLKTIEQAVENVMNRIGYDNTPSGGLNPIISLNVNGEEFARLTLGDILSEMSRQGYDVNVLGVTR